MGLFNVVSGRMTCPRCGEDVSVEVETRLVYMHDVQTLSAGDRYPWNHPGMPSRRPEGGNAVGDGYCVCPACEKDFFVNVVVEADGRQTSRRSRTGDLRVCSGRNFVRPPGVSEGGTARGPA